MEGGGSKSSLGTTWVEISTTKQNIITDFIINCANYKARNHVSKWLFGWLIKHFRLCMAFSLFQ